MPASDFNMFCVEGARNNFDVMRPAPICSDTNQLMGHCQKIHISTNCYYGYHDQKNTIARDLDNSKNGSTTDYEMMEVQVPDVTTNGTVSPQGNMRKRSGDDVDYPKNKRIREEVQREKSNEPETTENVKLDASKEDLWESLYWNIHGGNMEKKI